MAAEPETGHWRAFCGKEEVHVNFLKAGPLGRGCTGQEVERLGRCWPQRPKLTFSILCSLLTFRASSFARKSAKP